MSHFVSVVTHYGFLLFLQAQCAKRGSRGGASMAAAPRVMNRKKKGKERKEKKRKKKERKKEKKEGKKNKLQTKKETKYGQIKKMV